MRVLGVVVEYNPFHHGHRYHLKQAKVLCAPDLTVAVMSGQFTQRGEPAIMDKWARAEIALSLGVDLVLELPTAWAARSAGDFATGAVAHLQACGATHLCFGSESGDLEGMKRLAREQNSESAEFRASLRRSLAEGSSYARAKADALTRSTGGAPSTPNDILGLAYLAALDRLKSSMVPVAIRRKGSGYHDEDFTAEIASATAIRVGLRRGEPYGTLPMPEPAVDILRRERELGRAPVFWDSYLEALRFTLARGSAAVFKGLPDMEAGLPHRLANSPGAFGSFEELMAQVKTRRYTRTRLQRTLLYALLDLTSENLRQIHDTGPTYLRVLGLRRESSHLLNALGRTLPFVHNPSEMPGNPSLRLDALATDVYALGYPSSAQRQKRLDYTRQVVVL